MGAAGGLSRTRLGRMAASRPATGRLGDSQRRRRRGWARSRAILVAFASTLPSLNAPRAGEPKLAADEAIVLCRATSTTLRNMEYWRVGAKSGFFVTMRGTLTPRVVKAGRYYMHTYSTIYRTVFPSVMPEPKSLTATVDVPAGSVTYIGDVTVSQIVDRGRVNWRFAVRLNPRTLLEAEKSFPWLEKYPLYASKSDGEALRVRWSNDRSPARGVPGEEVFGGITDEPWRFSGATVARAWGLGFGRIAGNLPRANR
jgi:hypothetical protein